MFWVGQLIVTIVFVSAHQVRVLTKKGNIEGRDLASDANDIMSVTAMTFPVGLRFAFILFPGTVLN